MTIHLGTDHAGFALKEELKRFLSEQGHNVHDHGAYEENGLDDFTGFVARVAYAIEADPTARGIVLGGSGQGEAMLANKFGSVRAAVYYGHADRIVHLSRDHNDANVLSLGARFLTPEVAKQAVRTWLETPFSHDERHTRRIAQVAAHGRAYRHSALGRGRSERVVPAIMPSSWEDMRAKIERVHTVVSQIQIDLMDGSYSDAATYPYTAGSPPLPAASQESSASGSAPGLPDLSRLRYEVDLMVREPEPALVSWAAFGATRFIVHPRAHGEVPTLLARYGSRYDIAAAVHTDTSLEDLAPLIASGVRTVQFMGIATVGFQGSPFEANVPDAIRRFHERYPEVGVTVDGGVGFETVASVAEAGVERIVSGSAVWKHANPEEAVSLLDRTLALHSAC